LGRPIGSGLIMEKRALERIPVNVQANFFYGKTMYSGLVTNISQKGMYIKINVCPHFESQFELLLPFKNDVLKVLVEVLRFVNIDDVCYGMGIKVLKSSQEYLEFVESQRN
jgi:hypothetical protein